MANFSRNATINRSEAISSHSVFYLTMAVLLSLAIVVGNSLVLKAYHVNKRLRTGTYTILVSLAISDTLVGGVSLPLWIYGSLTGWTKVPPLIMEIFLCSDVFTALASIFHLTAVSIERYIAVARPYYFYTLSRKTYVKGLTGIWVVSLAVASLQPLQRRSPEAMLYYTGAILIVCFVIPIVVMSSVYAYHFSITRRILRKSHGSDKESRRKIIQRELKAIGTLVIITGLFACAWIPFFTLTALATFCPLKCLPEPKILSLLVSLVKWMHYCNSACNPFVYAFRDSMMKQTIRRVISSLIKWFVVARQSPPVRTAHIQSFSAKMNSVISVTPH